MKAIFISTLLLFITIGITHAQVGINATNAAPDGSAILDVSSTTRGLLIPRMTTSQKDAIANKTEGLMVYDTDLKQFSYWSIVGPIGNWKNFPEVNSAGAIPSETIVMSQTSQNSNLTNSGFNIIGSANLQYSEFSPESYLWHSPLSNTNSDVPRDSHSAIWTGSEMIIWGGYENNTNISNTGKIYNLATNTWRAMQTAPLVERAFPSASWTGSKMLIWGGDFYTDGAMYDPVSNGWTTISNSNAPSLRMNNSAAYTGSKLIIWGGRPPNNNNPFLADGKIYDTSSNTWTNISALNAPAGRQFHSTVWAGTKMIVFGGVTGTANSQTTTNTGGIYDPEANTWVTINSSGAPILKNHTAVWTGTKMIVWGGDANILDKTPYIFDPQTNTWATGTTVNAPVTRKYHTAIWSGTKMILFGGNTNNNDCSLYDPENNIWTNQNANLPGDSYVGHTAIWTGEEMIVYGPSPGYLMKKDFKPSVSKSFYLFQKN